MTPVSFTDFVRHLGHRLTRAQRVLCLVAFDGVEPVSLTGKDRELALQIFGPVGTVPPEVGAVVALVKGARIGGSWLCSLRAAHLMLTVELDGLAPGEQAFAVFAAPDTRLAGQCLRYVIGAFRSTPALERLIVSETTDSLIIRRPTDGRLGAFEVLPAAAKGAALRGRSLVSAVLSEVGVMRDRTAAVSDEEQFRGLSPRILPGGQLLLESTPWSEAGLLYELYRDNFGGPATALVARCPTLLMRDDLKTRAIVAAERLRDPINAAREFDVEFLGIGSGFFYDPAALRNSVDDALSLGPAPAHPGATLFAGGDLGLVADASAICVVRRIGTPPQAVYQIVDALEIRPAKGSPLDFRAVLASFAEVAERHGLRTIMMDHHLLPVASQMMPGGIRLVAAPGGKRASEVHLRVRDTFRAGVVRMPQELTILREQLAMITSAPIAGGGVSIRIPRRNGTHGDLASAAILALFAATTDANGVIDWDFGEAIKKALARVTGASPDATIISGISSWFDDGLEPDEVRGSMDGPGWETHGSPSRAEPRLDVTAIGGLGAGNAFSGDRLPTLPPRGSK